jgi:SAM-dependent methyltransferase
MVYLHPLAYLLGYEGVALLKAVDADRDRAFVEARVAEIRALLAEPAFAGDGVEATRVDTVDGYRAWSATYDEPGNGIFGYEEPYVRDVLEPLPIGVALDAACGTGRHAAHLAAGGHRVIGVDSSAEMLARARDRVPSGDFRLGDLHALPVAGGEVDVAVCALALTHVPALAPVLAELARVLRPGGHLVISDVHHERVTAGSVPKVVTADGAAGLLPAYRHRASDYLTAALSQGLTLRGCVEPPLIGGDRTVPTPGVVPPPAAPGDVDVDDWLMWPWTLQPLIPAAVRAVNEESPATVIWHFQRTA